MRHKAELTKIMANTRMNGLIDSENTNNSTNLHKYHSKSAMMKLLEIQEILN